MELKKKSFILHVDNLNVIEDMTDEQAGKLLKAMNAFHKGEEIELDPLTKMAFSFFKNQFIRDNEKYIKTCEARVNAGSKGGKQKKQNIANASKCYQKVAKVADSDSDSDSDKEKEKPNAVAKSILSFLNEVSGKSFKTTTKANMSMVNSLVKDGYSEEEVKLVCRFKNWQWKGSDMSEYIRPSTLFAKKNFDGYLQAAIEESRKHKSNTVEPENIEEIKRQNQLSEDAQMRRDLGLE